jgi:acetyl-CoA C-acetyltransferase
MHAMATMVTALRAQPDQRGLVWANGGYLTKHAIGLYGTEPLAGGFTRIDPQAEVDALGSVDVTVDAASGSIEGWTVMHDRNGQAERAYASLRTADGTRAWATTTDTMMLRDLCVGDWVGRTAAADADGQLVALR